MAVIQITNMCLIVERFFNPMASEWQTILVYQKSLYYKTIHFSARL